MSTAIGALTFLLGPTQAEGRTQLIQELDEIATEKAKYLSQQLITLQEHVAMHLKETSPSPLLDTLTLSGQFNMAMTGFSSEQHKLTPTSQALLEDIHSTTRHIIDTACTETQLRDMVNRRKFGHDR